MKAIVVGAGNIGRYLAADLAVRGHEVVVVDRNTAAIDQVPDAGVQREVGDGCAPEVQERVGMRTADVVVAATGDDEDNLVISLLAKQEFAVPRVLARVNHPVNEWLFDASWGVDLAVSPPHLLTALVEEEVSAGELVALLKLEHGEVEIVEVRLDNRSIAVGQRIEDLALDSDIAIVAVLRSGNVIPARPETALVEGDEVLAVAKASRRDAVHDALIGG